MTANRRACCILLTFLWRNQIFINCNQRRKRLTVRIRRVYRGVSPRSTTFGRASHAPERAAGQQCNCVTSLSLIDDTLSIGTHNGSGVRSPDLGQLGRPTVCIGRDLRIGNFRSNRISNRIESNFNSGRTVKLQTT